MPKALVTLPRADIHRLSASLERRGVKIDFQLHHGALVTLTTRQAQRLEAEGCRVKPLPEPDVLSIGGTRIDTRKPLPKVARALDLPARRRETWRHHLVQLAGPRTDEWIRAIEAEGVEVVEPISRYGLFVTGDPARINAIRRLPFVTWVGVFKPAYRLDPALSRQSGRIRHVSIGVYPAHDTDSVHAAIERAGGTIADVRTQPAVFHGEYGVLLAELDARRVAAIASHPSVRWLEWAPPDQSTDERTTQIVAENLNGAAAPNTAPVLGYQANLAALGLTGAGVTISVVDTGVDSHNNAAMQGDLAGRMAFFVDTTGGAVTTDVNGHGTHVAGIAVGNAATADTDPQGFLLGQGVAPGAQFGSINVIGTGGALADDLRVENSVNNGAQIMNNSWGAAFTAGYTSRSATFDLKARDPDDGAAGLEYLVIVSAAGNSGPAAGTVLNPWEAKNPIIVGNSLNFRPAEGDVDDIRGIRSTSSRGPAGDGRLLPTIVAPGTDIVSARSTADTDAVTPGVQRPRTPYTDTGATAHADHTQMSGTSMASPHVAGLCALLIQWWRNRTGGENLSPALLKALLVNGAEDCAGGPDGAGGALTNIPNNNQGWGRVSLENIIVQAPVSDRGPRIFSDQRHAFTANGQEHRIRVAAADPSRPLRITLVWTDAPGAAGANPALVNDLDLEITETATGTVFRGNVFANGFSTAGGAFDSLNNIECVYVQNPAGTYEVAVVAATVPASARPDIATPWQDFALVIENAEVPAAAPVSVVPVVDRSGSMVTFGYVDITRTSSKQFVDLMSVDDRLGVVSFGSTSAVEYPSGAAPALQTIIGQPTRDAAKTEIDGIVFGGCTFMGAGIQEAGNLLAGAAGTRAMVLLSDGYDNKGCDALNPAKPSALDAVAALPAGLPVYTCAMGPASDQVLLEQLAATNGGRYYYMPTIDDLFEIYNYIRGQVTGDGVIVNDSATASQSRMAAFVDACATELTLTVAWADTSLRYVPDAPHKANEIAIRLRDPHGRLLHPHDSYVRRTVGAGYVVFEMQEPMAGEWFVEVSTARAAHTRYTVGGFVRSPVRMVLSAAPLHLTAGSPLTVVTRAYDGKLPIPGTKADVVVRHPAAGIPYLLQRHKRALARIKPRLSRDTMPLDLAKLVTLRNRLVEQGEEDLFALRSDRVMMREAPGGAAPGAANRSRFEIASPVDLAVLVALSPIATASTTATVTPEALTGRFVAGRHPGTYNVIATVRGLAPGCRSRFVRKEMVSVLVR